MSEVATLNNVTKFHKNNPLVKKTILFVAKQDIINLKERDSL